MDSRLGESLPHSGGFAEEKRRPVFTGMTTGDLNALFQQPLDYKKGYFRGFFLLISPERRPQM
jgi:hypothetical protein